MNDGVCVIQRFSLPGKPGNPASAISRGCVSSYSALCSSNVCVRACVRACVQRAERMRRGSPNHNFDLSTNCTSLPVKPNYLLFHSTLHRRLCTNVLAPPISGKRTVMD